MVQQQWGFIGPKDRPVMVYIMSRATPRKGEYAVQSIETGECGYIKKGKVWGIFTDPKKVTEYLDNLEKWDHREEF